MAGYCLHNVPPDIFKFIIDEQSRLKKEKGTNQFSFACTIFKLLRDHPKFLEFKNKIEQNK